MPSQRRLTTRGPFHLQATVRVLQRRPVNRVDVWVGGRYLRVLPVANGHVLAAVTNRGTVNGPDLCFSLLAGYPRDVHRANSEQSQLVGQSLAGILGLEVDPEPLHRAALSEPGLREVASALRGMRPPRFAGLFETFLNVIPFQQLSLDTGIAIIGPWSAALVLLRGFRRLNVFPPGDVGAKRALGTLMHFEEGTFCDRVQRFGELRGYLYFLGLGGSLTRMGLIDAAGDEPA